MTMDGLDEDEQLRRAIELSLQESLRAAAHSTQTRTDATRREGVDEEEQFQADLAAAIEMSKAEAKKVEAGSRSLDVSSKIRGSNSTANLIPDLRAEREKKELRVSEEKQGPVPANVFLNGRAKMEMERLESVERMRMKRQSRPQTQAGAQGQDQAQNRKRGREEGENRAGPSLTTISPPTKKQRSSPTPPASHSVTSVDGSSFGTGSKENTKGQNANGQTEKRKGKDTIADGKEHELFWDGELRQIANRLVDKDKDIRPTFRLSEIVGPKPEITLAILSSYSNSMDWLYTFFEPTTPLIVVNQPEENGNSGLKDLAPNLIMTKPFIRNGRGCMHIKVLLLFYKDGRLRVVVPTANLIEYDWRDIENTAWVQDIPQRQSTIRHDPKANDFPGTLQRVLHVLNVPAALTKFLDGDFPELPIEALSELRMRWDWSKVKVKLVASIAGKHEGWDQVARTGHPALMRAIQELRATPPKGMQVVLECQGSSIGSYSTQWMNEFYCSARGESARVWLDSPRSQRAKLPWPSVKILFPSLQTVRDSVLGLPGGGTMFCRKAQWEAKNFPRSLFHDSNSKRGRVLMHSKMIIASFIEKNKPDLTTLRVGERRTGGHGNEDRDEGRHENGNHADDGDRSDENRGVVTVHPSGKTQEAEVLIGWAYVGSHNFTPSAWGTVSGSSARPSLNIVNYELGIVLPLGTYEELEGVACWESPPRRYVEGVDRPWMQEEVE